MERVVRLMLVVVFLLAAVQTVVAQKPPMGQKPPMEGRPGMGPGMRPGMGPGMTHGEGKPGFGPGMGRPGEFKPDPEAMKERERHMAILSISEAHKELASIYESKGQLDEAAAELRKIIDLAGTIKEDDNPKARGFLLKLAPVYNELARLYMMNDKTADAEQVVNEGIELFEDDLQTSSRLTLFLAELYKRNNQLDKAEETYKRVIELNQKSLK
jgi:tetratricopeptide (TPR) repeat protein